MIDLHCHSHYSDGTCSPDDLIRRAIKANLRMLALTDHDTIAGVGPLRQAARCQDVSLTIINGIEFSTRWKKYDIHILGLNVTTQSKKLIDLINRQQEARRLRAVSIAERLKRLGIEDAYQKACAVAGHEHLARPHFAQVLMNEGITKDIQEGFKRYLSRGKMAYEATAWTSVQEAIFCIKEAGGQAVIAHPLKYSLTRTKLRELIIDFRDAGGVGLEVISGDTTLADIRELIALCNRFNLFASTGSDFHHDGVSRTALGCQPKLPLNCMPIWHQWTS